MNIRLRAIEPTDVDMMYELENDPYLWSMGCTTVPYSRKALSDFIAGTQNDIYIDRQVRLVVECDGLAVGCVDLFDLDPRNLHAEIAIAILPAHCGRGVGREAVSQLAAYATGHLGLRTLRATTAVSNAPARRVFEQTGFAQCGLLKGWLRIENKYEDAIIYQYGER